MCVIRQRRSTVASLKDVSVELLGGYKGQTAIFCLCGNVWGYTTEMSGSSDAMCSRHTEGSCCVYRSVTHRRTDR